MLCLLPAKYKGSVGKCHREPALQSCGSVTPETWPPEIGSKAREAQWMAMGENG